MASLASCSEEAIASIPTGPPPNLSIMARSILLSILSKPFESISSMSRAFDATSRVITPCAFTWAKSARAGREPVRAPRGPPRPPGYLRRAVRRYLHAEYRGGTRDYSLQLGGRAEIEPQYDAKPVPPARREEPGPGRRAYEREFGELYLPGPSRRPLAYEYVYMVVLHRGVEYLLDRGGQPVDLIYEEDVPCLEVREHGREVAGLLDDRPRCRPYLAAELVGA